MSALILNPIEVVQMTASPSDDDSDVIELVCHCTGDAIAFCGLDVSSMPPPTGEWEEGDVECPLCMLAAPDGSPCPWGCACEECSP